MFFYNKLQEKALFFNEKGQYFDYKENKNACPVFIDKAFEALQKNSPLQYEDANDLFFYLDKMRTLDKAKVDISTIGKADFYVIMPWSIWLSSRHLKDVAKWEKVAKERKDITFKIIKVNTDFHKDWAKQEDLPDVNFNVERKQVIR